MKKFKKKIVLSDEKSLPKARANRLKRLRYMANLSREQMCDNGDMNINTYKGWEVGRYGGLPIDGAEKVINRIAQEGVICPIEWLIYEIGQGPYIISDLKTKHDLNVDERPKQSYTMVSSNFTECSVCDINTNLVFSTSYNAFVINEILLFKKQFENIMHCQIIDDGLSPNYNIGDYVAGIKYSGHEIHNCVNQDCIVQLVNGEILVRHLRFGSKPNSYMLMCTNFRTMIKKPVLYDVEVISVAPISRVYKENK